MKQSIFVVFLGVSCGSQYTSPKAEAFEDITGWGDGIDGFDPVASAPVDTSVGSAEYDGIYLGIYELTVSLDDGTACYCSESITMAIEEGDIQVGQASQCTMDCGYVSELRFDGVVQDDGSVSGPVVDEAAFGFGTPWTGLFAADGSGRGGFDAAVDTNLGAAQVTGTFAVTLQ